MTIVAAGSGPRAGGRPRAGGVWRLVMALLLVLLCAGCGGSVEPELSYKPEFLPVSLSIGRSGISIEGDDSLATPIGDFSIGARYSLPQPPSGNIYVILRDRKTGYDHIFQVDSGAGHFTAVVNGTTSISITNNQVLIDVTNGTINKVEFERTAAQIAEQGNGNWFSRQWNGLANRWNEGWSQSWYKPYGLTRWAYSDATIGKWYGAGFVWFLLRLVFAVLMAVVDTVLSLGFLVGQAFFLVFGPTGRDVVYGLMILGVLLIAGSAAAG
jgi:hypothetical protein